MTEPPIVKKTSIKPEGRKPERIPLENLLLDKGNPRFGFLNKSNNQEQILDHIVDKFGVDDILGSLSVNGYFEAEPLVCQQIEGEKDKVIVKEGNRRLAACLILTQDKRASNQIDKSISHRKIWGEHGNPPIDPVPVILFGPHEQEKALLSYLGVRHIAATQPWDSYAKAAWIAEVVESRGLKVSEVSKMIGDRHRTVARLLEGFYFINQLINKGTFVPENSLRGGKGSVTDYPFSWVYTILGYTTVRNFLELSDEKSGPDPIKSDENLEKGLLIIKAMFGDKSKAQPAALSDSRQLGKLAEVLGNQEKTALLEQGKTLDQIDILTQPIEKRFRQGLQEIRETFEDLLNRLIGIGLSNEKAKQFIPQSEKNLRLAKKFDEELRKASENPNED